MFKIIILVFMSVFINSCTSISKEECLEKNWTDEGKRTALKNIEPNKVKEEFRQMCTNAYDVKVDFIQFDRGYSEGKKIYCNDTHPVSIAKNFQDYSFPDDCDRIYRRSHLSSYKEALGKACSSVDTLMLGEKGKAYSIPNLCLPYESKTHKKRYFEGLTKYCSFENGMLQAKKENPYEGACPKSLEPRFLKGYQLGMQKLNLERLKKINDELESLNEEVDRLQRSNREKDSRIEELEDELRELR